MQRAKPGNRANTSSDAAVTPLTNIRTCARQRRGWLSFLGGVIGFAAVGWLAAGLDYGQSHRVLVGADPAYLAVLPLAVAAEQLVRAWKWRQILHPLRSIGTARLFGAIMAGYLANLLVPLGLSTLVRSWLVARIEALRMSAVLASVAIDRLIDGIVFAGLVLFVVVGDLERLEIGWSAQPEASHGRRLGAQIQFQSHPGCRPVKGHSSPAASGLPRSSCCSAGRMKPSSCSSGCSSCATMSACSRKNMTSGHAPSRQFPSCVQSCGIGRYRPEPDQSGSAGPTAARRRPVSSMSHMAPQTTGSKAGGNRSARRNQVMGQFRSRYCCSLFAVAGRGAMNFSGEDHQLLGSRHRDSGRSACRRSTLERPPALVMPACSG